MAVTWLDFENRFMSLAVPALLDFNNMETLADIYGRYDMVCPLIGGAAPEAQLLYRETEESIRQREELAAERKSGPAHWLWPSRPTRKQRRETRKFRENRNFPSIYGYTKNIRLLSRYAPT